MPAVNPGEVWMTDFGMAAARIGLTRVSCSPFRMLVARPSPVQAALEQEDSEKPNKPAGKKGPIAAEVTRR